MIVSSFSIGFSQPAFRGAFPALLRYGGGNPGRDLYGGGHGPAARGGVDESLPPGGGAPGSAGGLQPGKRAVRMRLRRLWPGRGICVLRSSRPAARLFQPRGLRLDHPLRGRAL